MMTRLFSKLTLLLGFSIGIAVGFTPASAQPPQRIAAVVNDELITFFDLTNRMNMIALNSGMPQERDAVERLARQVLRSLIDEKLKLQEARERNITVTQGELDLALENLNRSNGFRPGQMRQILIQEGIAPITLTEKLRADLAWSKVLRRLMADVQISRREIDDYLADLTDRSRQQQRLLAEIFIPVNTPSEDEEARQSIIRLRDIALQNNNFRQVATQFSQASSAAQGGDLGWMAVGSLAPEIELALEAMQPPRISGPIRTPSGYYLIAYRDRRDGLGADPDRARHTVAKMVLELAPDVSAEDRETASQWLAGILNTSDDCPAFLSLARQISPETTGTITGLLLSDVPAAVGERLGDLDINRGAGPFPVKEGLLVIMLCGRELEFVLPSEEEAEQFLLNRQGDAVATRRLRDLRRAAFIDIRA